MIRHFLTVQHVLAFHSDQINRYGGSPGVRDMGQLQAALFRPQSGYYHDVLEEAAALWESLSQNHPFIDGNKRTAFAAMYIFLQINGLEITATSEQVWTFLSRLYTADEMCFERLVPWLRANTAPISGT